MTPVRTTISLLTLPVLTGNESDPPEILIDQGGFWRGPNQMPPVAGADKKTEIEQYLDQMMREVEKAIANNTKPNAGTNLRAQFGEHYEALVPPSVRETLKVIAEEAEKAGAVPKLRIHAHPRTEWVPWEILHDGKDYLGLRFQVARLPIVGQGPELMETVHPVRRIYHLLGEHALEKPADAKTIKAWANTFKDLAGTTVDVKQFPDGNGAADVYPSVDQVELAATDAADIIHLTCHGGIRDPNTGDIYWTLNHKLDSPITHRITSAITKSLGLKKARPLIFGNACASVGSTATNAGLKPTLASVFFDYGALAFIGPFAPIAKGTAIDFATKFYRNLLGAAGLPIGEALWKTKTEFRPAPGDPLVDPSWLFYCLYGSPELKFEIQP
jgi:CHAT domain-containing protein